jgi:hypothetical protein
MDWIATLKVADLKEELRKRQLPVSGKKQELVERLAAVVADEVRSSRYYVDTLRCE